MTHGPKTADDWFDEYAVCHQNEMNKLLHWICIPLIVLSLFALVWSIPVPEAILGVMPVFNWAWVLILLSNIFYWRLSKSLAIGMLVITAVMIGIILAYQQTQLGPLWIAGSVVFVLAWIGQFVGHKIEGAKPAFIDDLKFLLIGPLWLLGFVYRKLGIRY